MNKFLILILLILFFGCKTDMNHYDTDILKIKQEFKEGLLSHFPKKSLQDYYFKTSFPEAAKHENRCGVVLVTNLTEQALDSLKSEIDLLANKKLKPSDKCFMIVNQFNSEAAGGVYLEHFRNYCDSPDFPIPNFMKILRGARGIPFTSEGRISDEYTFYLIDAKQGKFLEEGNLPYGFGLPDEWKNGYSKGIAIGEKNAIYWLEIW